MTETHYRRNPMRRLAAFTVLTILCLSIAVSVNAWTVEDCEEVNYDHPDCDQYPTTTTYQTTTTEPEVTTTTPNETTTTTPFEEQTTTTGAPCAEGLIHQPPLCVNPSTTVPQEVEVSSTVVTAIVLETLPMTGAPTFQLLAAASALLLLAGMAVLSFRRNR